MGSLLLQEIERSQDGLVESRGVIVGGIWDGLQPGGDAELVEDGDQIVDVGMRDGAVQLTGDDITLDALDGILVQQRLPLVQIVYERSGRTDRQEATGL